MKKNFKLIMVAVAAVAMAACAKNGGEGPVVKEGKPTSATISFTQTPAKYTRGEAGNDFNKGTDAEMKIFNATLFVFDANKQLENIVKFDTGLPWDGKTASSAPSKSFDTTNGTHTLILLANMSSTMSAAADALTSLDEIAAGSSNSVSTYANFLAATSFAAWANQSAFETAVGVPTIATGGLFISNFKTATSALEHNFEVPTEENPTPAANNITLEIGRGFAKAVADWDVSDGNTNSGTVQELKYIMLNNPRASYGAQNWVSGVYQSIYHNVNDYDNYYDWDGTTAGQVWKTASGEQAANATYIPENTNAVTIQVGEVTGMGFKAKFRPTNVYKTTLAGGGNLSTAAWDNAATWTVGSSFFRIKDLRTGATLSGIAPSGNGTDNAVIEGGEWIPNVYFDAKPTSTAPAQMAAIRKALGVPVSDLVDPKELYWDTATLKWLGDYAVYEYKLSECYYTLSLKNEAESGIAQYYVGRNDFFWVNITSIQECGEPSLLMATPSDDDMLSTPVNITAKVQVMDWTPVKIDAPL